MKLGNLLETNEYVVLRLPYGSFRPFTKFRGPVSFAPITTENVASVADSFPAGKLSVFEEKLGRGDVGAFAYYDGKVVGYMWRRDYDTDRVVKADRYVPLSGRFSHFSFARVDERMRGRALQLGMFAQLIEDAHANGIETFYTDMEKTNRAAIGGALKIGFEEVFDVWVLRWNKRPLLSRAYNRRHPARASA